MPRKASQQSPNVKVLIQEILDYCHSTNTSILALSKQAGVQQSALARFLNGERKSVTSTARQVSKFLHNRHNWHNQHSDILEKNFEPDHEGLRLINSAIESLWDGHLRSAEIIAALVTALKPALEIAARQSQGGQ